MSAKEIVGTEWERERGARDRKRVQDSWIEKEITSLSLSFLKHKRKITIATFSADAALHPQLVAPDDGHMPTRNIFSLCRRFPL